MHHARWKQRGGARNTRGHGGVPLQINKIGLLSTMQQPHSPALVALALFLSTCLRTPPRILVASTNGPPVPRGAHVFCLNTGRPARVDSLVHVSDIVTTGRLLRATQGVHGTQTASVNAYFMYKSDERVNPTLWGQTMLTVKNFYNVSSSMLLEEMAMLFLVREPSDDIALLCYTNRLAITTTTVGRGQGGVEGEGESDIVQELLSVMDTMEEVGIGEYDYKLHCNRCSVALSHL